MPETSPEPRYCQHVLTVLPDGSTEISHTWYTGGASGTPPPIPAGTHYVNRTCTAWEQGADAEVEERHAQHLRVRHAEGIKRAEVTAKAQEVLFSMLTESQRKSYTESKQVEFIGSHGNRYILESGSEGNITWFKPGEDEYSGRLCAHPRFYRWMPHPAVIASQMLALTTDEPKFMSVACTNEGRKPRFPEWEKAQDKARRQAELEVAGQIAAQRPLAGWMRSLLQPW
jgi:hypothetical protein